MARKTVRRYYHDERLRFAALETKKGALRAPFCVLLAGSK
jgi:hypothetical protein